MIIQLQNEWLKIKRHLRLLWVGALAILLSGVTIQSFFDTALRAYGFWRDSHPNRTFSFFIYQHVEFNISILQFLTACLVSVIIFDTETNESLIRLTKLLPVSNWKILLAKLLISMLLLVILSVFAAGMLAILQIPVFAYMDKAERLEFLTLAKHYTLKAVLMIPVVLLAAGITIRFFGKPLVALALSLVIVFTLMNISVLPYLFLFKFSAVNIPSFDLIDLFFSIVWTIILGRWLYKQFQ